MELVTHTERTHATHGNVHIEDIYRTYAIYDTETGGSVPGGWHVKYSTSDDETMTEPIEDFIDKV